MKRFTVISGSLALLLSLSMNSVLHASDPVMQSSFFVADENHHQWVNERGGRTGVLEVNGALLSSPCVLMTNEVSLPPRTEGQKRTERYPLKLALVGCGEGGSVTSATSPAGVASTIVVHSALLSGQSGGVLQPDQRVVGEGRASLHGGNNQLTYFLSAEQQHVLTEGMMSNRTQRAPLSSRAQNDMLSLRLDYE